MVFIVLLFFSFIASYFMTLLALKYATKTGLLDHPGKRSSHNISTPRGGGISIVIIFIISIIFIWSSENETQNPLILGIVFGGLLVAAIGFWD
ncbi:MAG: glycosyl transferase, partial [Thiohalomonadales bacterium]